MHRSSSAYTAALLGNDTDVYRRPGPGRPPPPRPMPMPMPPPISISRTARLGGEREGECQKCNSRVSRKEGCEQDARAVTQHTACLLPVALHGSVLECITTHSRWAQLPCRRPCLRPCLPCARRPGSHPCHPCRRIRARARRHRRRQSCRCRLREREVRGMQE